MKKQLTDEEILAIRDEIKQDGLPVFNILDFARRVIVEHEKKQLGPLQTAVDYLSGIVK